MQYEVLIKKDGRVVTEPLDAQGHECETKLKPLQVRLGTVTRVENTPAYDHQPSHVSTKVNR